MEIDWRISETDLLKITDFVNQQSNEYVANRVAKNINYHRLFINRDTILHALLYSMILPNMKHSIDSPVASFFKKRPSPFIYVKIKTALDVNEYIFNTLKKNGILLDKKKSPEFFAVNFDLLESSNWALIDILKKKLRYKEDKQAEREIADYIDTMFKGFGAIEARIFLQYLGLTRYEIPIDSFVSEWLNDFGFPIHISTTALQDRGYYHFVSDGIQLLCNKANIYPCVLEAAIYSFNEKNIPQ